MVVPLADVFKAVLLIVCEPVVGMVLEVVEAVVELFVKAVVGRGAVVVEADGSEADVGLEITCVELVSDSFLFAEAVTVDELTGEAGVSDDTDDADDDDGDDDANGSEGDGVVFGFAVSATHVLLIIKPAIRTKERLTGEPQALIFFSRAAG